MSCTSRRQRQQIFETAFVSSTKSSTEDLDEVDRIANHPVLRDPLNSSSNTGLRRSRSEMGGSVDRGVSAFLARSPGLSPVNRSLVIQDFRSGGINRGLSRSTTACSALSNFTSPLKYGPANVNAVNPEKSPVSSAGRSPQTLTRNMRHQKHRSKTPIRSRVTAIIEGSSRKCITPPPNFKTYTSCNPTPPNTAPLPKKTRSPLSNFEGTQFHEQNYSSHSNSSCLSQTSSGLNLNKLTGYARRKNLEEQISSTESTPQKIRWKESQCPVETDEALSKPEKMRHPQDVNRNPQYDNGVNRPRPNIYQSKNFLKVQNKFASSKDSSACSSMVSSMESVESNTSEGVGSSISESFHSAVSVGLNSSCHASETSLCKPPLDLRNSRVSRIMSKLQILSPISDKSQEQTSSPSSDNNGKSGTGSPQDMKANYNKILTEEDVNQNVSASKYSYGSWSSQERLHKNQAKNRNVDLNLNLNLQDVSNENSISFKTLRTPDIQQYLNVPWDIPKLKSKLRNKRNCFRGQSSSPESSPKKIQKSPDIEVLLSDGPACPEKPDKVKNLNIKFGDFSDVKCHQSLKTPELEKFLEVPWEVPKLKKKLANRKKLTTFVNIQGSDSGISMSSQETKDLVSVPPWPVPKLKHRSNVYIEDSICTSISDKNRDNQNEIESTSCLSINIHPAKVAHRDATYDSSSMKSSTDSYSSSYPRNSVNANSEFHFQLQPFPVRGYSDGAKEENSNDTLLTKQSSDIALQDRISLQQDCDNPSSLAKSTLESDNSCSENTDMKTKDLNCDLPSVSDLSNLPFSMPKLERRIKESRVSSSSSSSMRIESSSVPAKPSLNLAPPSSLNLNHPPKPLRPSLLSCPNPPIPTKPSISQLKLPLQTPGGDSNKPTGLQLNLSGGRVGSPAPNLALKRKPLLFLTPTLNLSQSVDVDVSIPLENQEWYHGVMSRVEGENLLKSHAEGSYLLRANLDHGKTEYSLAIKSSRGFMHLRIFKNDDGENTYYRLGEFDKKFSSIVQMVRHYSINRLPIKGAEHMCLLTPVTEELL